MGLVSDVDMLQRMSAAAEPFQIEPAKVSQPANTPATFPDEARQAEEAQNAPAVLAQINEQAQAAVQAPASKEDDEAKKRAEHEAAEAARKAEFDARQRAKKEALQKEAAKVAAMSDDEVMQASMARVAKDTERLTRRNMKDCVSEHIQTLCLDDPAFARLAMDPRKNMINCFHYINRKAKDFAMQEMKDNGFKHESGVYGTDVPDDLCYQWAEEYFRDPNAPEDKEKEEKFSPKPYPGGKVKRTSKKPAAKKAEKKPEPKAKPQPKPEPEPAEQLSFGEQLGFDSLAGQEVAA